MNIARAELELFVLANEIGEEFNYAAEYLYTHYKDDKLVGVLAFSKERDKTGREYPRFCHIILGESFRGTKESYKFLVDSLSDLKNKGYDTVIAIVPHWKKHIQWLILRLRFKEYEKDDKYGYWFVKIDDIINHRR